MTITVAPEQDPGQVAILQPLIESPYSGAWSAVQTAAGVPESSIGWLLAQGWRITGVTNDTTTIPPTVTYDITRDSLQNWNILQSLLTEYVRAHNVALEANAIRYNDIVINWTALSETSQDYAQTQIEEQIAHTSTYLLNLDTYMSASELLISDNETAWSQATTATAALLTQGQTNYDAFANAYDELLNGLATDHLLHASTTRGLLEDLGTTQLARIQEEHAASLAVQYQQLVDRGLYSSTVITDIATRVLREKGEAIGEHNDKLSREKLGNEHQLYGQLADMRGKTLAGKDRLEVLGQEITRWRHAQTLQATEADTTARSRRIAELMGTSAVRLEGLAKTHGDNIRLMQYTLDERNKLIVGLYGFVERREDAYPQFETLVQLATGLGDAGGGWVTP